MTAPALTLLRNAELYDPAPAGRRDVLIAGERIVWVGEHAGALPAGVDASVVDLEGRRLVPGFIDCHSHLTGGGGEAGPQSRVPPLQLSGFTLGGVTTVVGVLGTDDTIRTPAELVVATHGLRAEGLSAFCYTGGYHVPVATVTGSVRRDIVLLDAVIGVGELAISDHRSSQPTLEELLRIAADAHVGGLMTGKAGIVHLHVGDGARGLAPVRDALDASELPARVFHPTHVNRRRALFDEALALADRGSVIDITAFPPDDDDDAWPAAEALRRYHAATLPPERVTLSSDAGGCLPVFDPDGRVVAMDVGRPGAVAAVLSEMLAAGDRLEAVLPACTGNPARLLRLARKGRIAAGADADLVVLGDDHAVRDVMALGRWHVREARPVVRGTFEPVPGR